MAKLALPSGIFQINEPILFGLPIIMNPVMFIPSFWFSRFWRRLRWWLTIWVLFRRLPILRRGPCQPGWGRSLTPTAASPHYWLRYLTRRSLPDLSPFVVVANKAQNAIEQEESEEDIANALKF